MGTGELKNYLLELRHFVPESAKRWMKDVLRIRDMEWILQNMKKNGFTPDAVVDVGAYKGEWTNEVRGIFPEATFLMVEPQTATRGQLEQMARQDERVAYRNDLLASQEGNEVSFHLHGSVSSVLAQAEAGDEVETRTTTTLDHLIANTPFEEPDFIKLDVQGYELEVLQGATQTLEENPPEAMILETSLIDCIGGAPLFQEVCQFMAKRDYRVYDFCTFYRRPLDGALWQVDTVFVHEGSELIASSQYR